MFTPRQAPITEAELTTINGLVARAKRLTSELAMSRDSGKIANLSLALDGVRWTLITIHGVEISPWKGRPTPTGKMSA